MFKTRRAVFLDRDGVVNEVVFRDGIPASPRSLEEFVWVDGIQEAIARLKAASFHVFVITNQPDVARKKLASAVVEQISETIRQSLPIDDILVCPHDNPDACTCRKPLPGMLLSLAELWQIDLRQSFIIGDSWKDMSAGKSAGCKTILIERQYNAGTESDYKAANLSDTVDIILDLINQGDRLYELRDRLPR
jgi:D-glycero-D-manno-heptose 1,7-bisphosphate phosphatase